MSQQMSHEENYHPGAAISYGYEGTSHYNSYAPPTSGQKLTGQAWGHAPSANQRLILAIISLILMMVMTFGLILLAMSTNADATAGIVVTFLLALFYAATVMINVVFNRKR